MLGNGVKKAEASIVKLREARAKLHAQTSTAAEELRKLSDLLPDVDFQTLLDNSAGPAVSKGTRQRIRELEDELASAPGLEAMIIQKLQVAIRELFRARADEIGKQAAKLRQQLEVLALKRNEHLTALLQLEGVDFVANVLPLGWHGTGEGTVPFNPSKSMRLQQESSAVEAECTALQNKQPEGAGADGANLEEVLARIAGMDLEIVTPSPGSVKAWYQDALAEAEADFRQMDHDSDFPALADLPREVSISLSWNADAKILPGSRVTIRLAPIPRMVAAERFGASYARALEAD